MAGSSIIPPRVPRDTQSALLRAVIERAVETADKRPPLVVFDLDGTLLDNRPRSLAILHELAETWAARHPREADLLKRTEHHRLAYLIEESLARIGVHSVALVEEALSFWRDRFFTDDFLVHDQPTAGAREFARACYDAGATLVYFTGRDLPNMALGSLASLRDLGFPIGVPGTQLVLKPHAAADDTEFKRTHAPRLARSGDVVAAFDNEPGNCNLFRDVFPDAASFLVDTQHLPGAPALYPSVHVIENFEMTP